MFILTRRITALILTFLFVAWGFLSASAGEEQLALAFVFGIWAMLTKDK